MAVMLVAGVAAYLVMRRKEKYKPYGYIPLICIVTAFLGLASGLTKESLIVNEEIMKNEAGEGDKNAKLTLQVPGVVESEDYELVVPERERSKAEKEKLFAAAQAELDAALCGENASLEEISDSISMPETLVDGQVKAVYEWEPMEYVEEDGNISWQALEQDTALVEMSVSLSCGGDTKIYKRTLRLVQPELSERENVLRSLGQYFTEKFEKEGSDAAVKLPQSVDGYSLSWKEADSGDLRLYLMFAALAIAAVTIAKQEEKRREKKARRQELLVQYPDMVDQMALLLNAGMNAFGAWERLVLRYRNGREQNGKRVAVYEEMLRTYYEIKDGVSESSAYERFAGRCELQQYRRFCGLLIQNIKKGSKGILEKMEMEVMEAFAERKSTARKLGEEAGTKLLFPMILMLGIVLLILLMPVMLSMDVL